jgi:hypothetical protein
MLNTGLSSLQIFQNSLDAAFKSRESANTTCHPVPLKKGRSEAPPLSQPENSEDTPNLPTEQRQRSFLELRDEQVKLMAAGTASTKNLRGNWPTASACIQRQFANRHAAFKTYSSGYLRSQERFLFLLDVPPENRFLRFEQECFERALAPTTAHCYWIAFATLDKILSPTGEPTPAVQRIASILENRVWLHPVAFPHPLTTELRKHFADAFSSQNFGAVALVEACWALGQRFGDFIQLAISDFLILPDTVIITFRRGKTIVHTKPYSLVLDRHCKVTMNLLEVRDTATARGWLFLTSRFNDAASLKALSLRTATLLSQVDDRLEIRSIRRGGLQHMASLGHSVEKMRLFSKHRSDEMLLRYLNWGQAAGALNEEILQISSTMTAAC